MLLLYANTRWRCMAGNGESLTGTSFSGTRSLCCPLVKLVCGVLVVSSGFY